MGIRLNGASAQGREEGLLAIARKCSRPRPMTGGLERWARTRGERELEKERVHAAPETSGRRNNK